ncbi:MAG: phospholipase D family protein [Pseudomonadota bacterium]
MPALRPVRLRPLRDREHYTALIAEAIPRAQVSLWIASATVKDLQVEAPRGSRARASARYVSFLDVLEGLHARKVELRLLYGGFLSRPFVEDLRRHRALHRGGLQIRHCPRVHLKLVVIDGALLYLGSANLTGAGLGAKGEGRRNFELGMLSDDDALLDEMQGVYETIWSGSACGGCRRRDSCPAPLDAKTGTSRGFSRRRV